MEAGNNGAGQVRRIHIIYFLSRGGTNEDPHLIRVRYRNGVYLRDVKRWLSNLRGKDMPEAYAWSYKRRYKHGYVWQDLLDDDLITPISDSEYVLKGSQITPTFPFDSKKTISNSCSTSKENPPSTKEGNQVHPTESQIRTIPTKTSSEITEDSKSTVTGESLEQEKKMSSNTHQKDSKKAKDHQSSFYARLLDKKNKMESILLGRNTEKNNGNHGLSTSSSSSSSSSSAQPSFSRSKSYTNGTSQAILSWLPCRSTDTNDAIIVSASCSADNKLSGKVISRPEVTKVEKMGESGRIFSTCLDYQPLHHPDYNGRKSCDGFKTSTGEFAADKPRSEPNCKQCGKSVKPESWIKHVHSCKETKALLKKAAAAAAASSEGEPSRKSFSHF